MDPPLSDPTPRIDPLKPIRAPSPPDDPPQDNVRLNGFCVCPYI